MMFQNNNSNLLKVNKFDLRMLKPDKGGADTKIIVCCGKKRSGKSSCAMNLSQYLYNCGCVRERILVSDNPEGNHGKFSMKIQPKNIPQLLSALEKTKVKRKHNVLIVIDDAYSRENIGTVYANDNMLHLYNYSRHYGIYIIHCIHSINVLPSALRKAVDFLFLFNIQGSNELQNTMKNYALTHQQSSAEFYEMIETYTKQYCALVFNMNYRNTGTNPYYWFKNVHVA